MNRRKIYDYKPLDLLDSEDKDAYAKGTSLKNNFDEGKRMFQQKKSNKHTESVQTGEDHTAGHHKYEEYSYKTNLERG